MDVPLYDKFEALTPETSVGRNGTVTQYKSRLTPDPSSDDARFCYDFAVEAVLALRDVEMASGFQQSRNATSARVRVTAPCELIVHPNADPPEVIRVAQPDEELLIAPRPNRRLSPLEDSEFVQIIQDGDAVYVRRDCLQGGFDLTESADNTAQ